MKCKYMISGWLLFAVAMPVQARLVDDHLIVPGERIGFITQATTERILKDTLRPNQLQRSVYNEGEGELRCASDIFSGTERALSLIWKRANQPDMENEEDFLSYCERAPLFEEIDYVAVTGSAWRTQSGARIGINLGELEQANGAPVTFAYGPFCGSGHITDWRGGMLSVQLYRGMTGFPVFDVILSDPLLMEEEPIKAAHAKGMGGIDSSGLPEDMKKQFTIERMHVYLKKNIQLPTDS